MRLYTDEEKAAYTGPATLFVRRQGEGWFPAEDYRVLKAYGLYEVGDIIPGQPVESVVTAQALRAGLWELASPVEPIPTQAAGPTRRKRRRVEDGEASV